VAQEWRSEIARGVCGQELRRTHGDGRRPPPGGRSTASGRRSRRRARQGRGGIAARHGAGWVAIGTESWLAGARFDQPLLRRPEVPVALGLLARLSSVVAPWRSTRLTGRRSPAGVVGDW